MRRLGLWLIVVVLLVGSVRPAAAAWRSLPGEAVGDPRALACIEAAVLRGYLGDSARVSPTVPVAREDLVIALVRFLGLEGEAQSLRDAAPGFRDAARILQICPWARGYLAAAQRAGLLSPGGEFRPGEPASRSWAAELAVRALGLQAEAELRMADRLPFSDLRGFPVDRLGYLAVAAGRGLMEGFGDGTFRPRDPLTWSQLALLLERMALRRPGPGGGGEVRGTLVRVEGPASALVVRVGTGNPRTYRLAEDAVVLLDAWPADLADLHPGMLLSLVSGAERWVALVSAASPAGREPATLLGWLVLVGPGMYGMVPPARWSQVQCFLDRGWRWRGDLGAYVVPVTCGGEGDAAGVEMLLGRLVVARAVRLAAPSAASFQLGQVREVLLVPGLLGG